MERDAPGQAEKTAPVGAHRPLSSGDHVGGTVPSDAPRMELHSGRGPDDVPWPTAVAAEARSNSSGHRSGSNWAPRAGAMVRGALALLECELLGRRWPSPREAMESWGWRADSPGAWCGLCGATLAGSAVRSPAESTAFAAPQDSRDPLPRCQACVTAREGAGTGDARTSRRQDSTRLPLLVDSCTRLGPYIPPLSEWVLGIKHGRWVEMAEELGRLLAAQMLHGQAQARQDRRPTIVVPVPMPWLRRWERGIDHSRALATAVGDVLGAPVVSALARRAGPTHVSSGSRRSRRARSHGVRVSGHLSERGSGVNWLAEVWPPRARWTSRGLVGHNVVLVDDVRTTGATLEACCLRLRALGAASIDVAVVAVAD